MSLSSRTFGLACDQLLGLEMVLFNGTVVYADRKKPHRDLFWASCGGGGGLGIATEYVIKLHRMPADMVSGGMVGDPSGGIRDRVSGDRK